MKTQMNIRRRFTGLFMCLALLTTILSGTAPAFAQENVPTITITVPSAAHGDDTLRPDRDFYVAGNIEGIEKDLLDTYTLNVTLQNARGDVLREVSSTGLHTERETNIDWFWEKKGAGLANTSVTHNNELVQMLMPELVYDSSEEDSMWNAWRKCCFNENSFSALFTSNTYTEFIRPLDRRGQPLPDLTVGPHTITATLLDKNNNMVATTHKNITLGYTANKVMARFSPLNHRTSVMNFADQNGYRVYNDPLAGIWYPAAYMKDWSGPSGFVEIFHEWRQVDMTEYANGTAHFMAYNVKIGSATYNAEIGVLTKTNRIDTDVKSYHYDIGEPSFDGKNGEIVPFSNNTDKMDFTRFEIVPKGTSDNYFNADAPVEYNWYAKGTVIEIPVGSSLAINGAVAPIQTNEFKFNDQAGWYDISNRIAKVRYIIDIPDTTRKLVDKNIGLTRAGKGFGDTDTSIFEFRNVFEISPDWVGKTGRILANPMDIHGNIIPGSEEWVYFTIVSAVD